WMGRVDLGVLVDGREGISRRKSISGRTGESGATLGDAPLLGTPPQHCNEGTPPHTTQPCYAGWLAALHSCRPCLPRNEAPLLNNPRAIQAAKSKEPYALGPVALWQ